jgi:hypothetical protein
MIAEQLFRFFDPALDQILVRGFMECLPKQPQEVITREAGLFGNLVKTQRMIVTVVDEVTRPTETL